MLAADDDAGRRLERDVVSFQCGCAYKLVNF
jgi:hypothetical protein